MNFVRKFLGNVRFGNDQIAKIMGYGDYQLGNVKHWGTSELVEDDEEEDEKIEESLDSDSVSEESEAHDNVASLATTSVS
ncbi:hypothetical protein Tco_1435576 [Tanacetum coccineum]